MILTDDAQNREVSAKLTTIKQATASEQRIRHKKRLTSAGQTFSIVRAWEDLIFSKAPTKQQLFQSVLFLQRELI